MATGTLRDLLASGMSHEEINALLSQSNVSTAGYDPMGTTGRGEPYMPSPQGYGQAGMVEQAPVNMIRNNSTGRTFVPTDMYGQPSQSQPAGPITDPTQGYVDTPYGRGMYLKGDATRVVLQNGQMLDLGRDTGAERARTKENLALDAQRANIAHTQAQTAGMTPAAAAEMERQKAMGRQQGEMAAFGAAGAAGAQAPTGDAALAVLPPAVQEQVKALAEGRMAFPTGRALSTPYWQSMLQSVAQYDPTFDTVNYNKRNKTASAFAAGPTADKVRNLNQSLIHAEKLSGNIEDLNNSDTLPGVVNPVSNYLGEKIGGQTTQNNFRQTVQALSSEMRKLFAAQGGGSLAELKKWEESFPMNAGKEQQKAYLKNGMELLSGGMSALDSQYQEGMGPKAKMDSLLSPAALLAARSFGLRSGGAAPPAATASGALVPAANEQQALTLPPGTRFRLPDGRTGTAR